MTKNLMYVVSLLAFLFLMGCTTNASNKQYADADLAGAAPTAEGTVISKRQVLVEGKSEIGGLAGTAGGAAAGSSLGGSARGSILGAIGGAVIGGLAGSAIEKGMTKQTANEYIVKLAQAQKLKQVTGKTRDYTEKKTTSAHFVTVVQSDTNFNVGEKVFVILSSKPRIVKNVD